MSTDYSSIGRLFDQLEAYVRQQQVKFGDYFTAIWHDPEYKETDVDGEAAIALSHSSPAQNPIQVYELPGWESAACVVHRGSYNTIDLAYNAILEWINANGYQIVGANREIYLQGGCEQDNESYVTEIQFPVEKV